MAENRSEVTELRHALTIVFPSRFITFICRARPLGRHLRHEGDKGNGL